MLNNIAIDHYKDHIGIWMVDKRWVMISWSSFHELIKGILNQDLSPSIDGGCRLIQDQNLRTERKTRAIVKSWRWPWTKTLSIWKIGIVPLWQLPNEEICIGCFGCFYDFFSSCIWTRKGDIFMNGPDLKPSFLQDHTKLLAVRSTGVVRNWHPINRDLSRINRVETHEQINQGRLSSSCRSYNGHFTGSWNLNG